MTQNLKLNKKLTHVFLELWLASFTPKVQIIHENAITFFLFENAFLTLSPSSSSSIHNIVIAINTPTTMNNQFEALNVLKNWFTLFLSQFLWTKNNVSFTFSPYSSKNPKILILKFLWFIEPLKLTILSGSLLFEIMGAWRRLMCAKQVISLVETMKSVFCFRYVRPDGCRRLTWKSSGQCRGWFCSWLLNVFW